MRMRELFPVMVAFASPTSFLLKLQEYLIFELIEFVK